MFAYYSCQSILSICHKTIINIIDIIATFSKHNILSLPKHINANANANLMYFVNDNILVYGETNIHTDHQLHLQNR